VLDGLFPPDVMTAWGDPQAPSMPLFPEEEALVVRAVAKRKREFAKGRECARSALANLGHRDVLLLSGESREPLWPAQVVGSITHTHGLCAAAVARSARYRGIGIDAEPAEPLGPDIVRRICGGDDRSSWARVTSLELPVVPRLVFCVKEAVYKCLFPITRMFLGFEDVTVELDEGTFCASLRIDAPPFSTGASFTGRWRRTGSGESESAYVLAAAWTHHPD
jgi:enterobactin synthetase component D / holo-[acyl-carrier protein] synthase